MRRIFVLAFAAGLGLSCADAKTSTFKVEGTNPGGSGGYQGTVALTSIEGTGVSTEVFKVVYTLGNSTVEGIAMVSPSNKNALTISFPDGSGAGVLVMVASGDTAKGQWFAPSQTAVGSEIWTPVSDQSGGAPPVAQPAPAGKTDYDQAVECAAATGYVVSSLRATPSADQAKITAYDTANTAWVNRVGDVAGDKTLDQRISDIQARQSEWAMAGDGMEQATAIADQCVANPPPASP